MKITRNEVIAKITQLKAAWVKEYGPTDFVTTPSVDRRFSHEYLTLVVIDRGGDRCQMRFMSIANNGEHWGIESWTPEMRQMLSRKQVLAEMFADMQENMDRFAICDIPLLQCDTIVDSGDNRKIFSRDAVDRWVSSVTQPIDGLFMLEYSQEHMLPDQRTSYSEYVTHVAMNFRVEADGWLKCDVRLLDTRQAWRLRAEMSQGIVRSFHPRMDFGGFRDADGVLRVRSFGIHSVDASLMLSDVDSARLA